MRFLDKCPWWASAPLAIGGTLLSAFASRFPERYQDAGLYLGISFIVFGLFGLAWHFRKDLLLRIRFGLLSLRTSIFMYLLSLVTIIMLITWNRFDFARGPIIWTFGDGPHPVFDMRGDGDGRTLFSRLQFTGRNRSDYQITNVDGFAVANKTYRKLPIYFFVNGSYVKTVDTNGIPSNSDFMIIVPISSNKDDFDKSFYEYKKAISDLGGITLYVYFEGIGSPYILKLSRDQLLDYVEDYQRESRQPDAAPMITVK